MKTKQRSSGPTIAEVPVVVAGFVVASAAMAVASALLWTVRTALRVSGLDRPEAGVAHRRAA